MRALLVAGLVTAGIGGCSKPNYCEGSFAETAAFVASQGFAGQALKTPASATFPVITAPGVSVQKTGECAFTVKAFVDAENSFGAKLRTRYVADLKASPSGGHELMALRYQ